MEFLFLKMNWSNWFAKWVKKSTGDTLPEIIITFFYQTFFQWKDFFLNFNDIKILFSFAFIELMLLVKSFLSYKAFWYGGIGNNTTDRIPAICKMLHCPLPLASVWQMISVIVSTKGLILANISLIKDYDVKLQQCYSKDQQAIIFPPSLYLLNYKQRPDSKLLIKFSLLVFFYAKGPWVT